MAVMTSKPENIGKAAPDFNLLGVDGKKHSLQDALHGKKACVLMFICNHCPYVVAQHDHLYALINEFQEKGVSFVGINSNDEKNYPADSFDNMLRLNREKTFPFAYLRDADQSVARAYDAVCTPEFFVIDAGGVIRYHGGINEGGKQIAHPQKPYLQNALCELLAGKPITEATPHAMGCSIKWS